MVILFYSHVRLDEENVNGIYKHAFKQDNNIIWLFTTLSGVVKYNFIIYFY